MNKLCITFVLFTVSFSGLCKVVSTPDLLVYSKMNNTAWNVFLLDEVEQVLRNFSIGFNPRSYRYDEAIVYDNSNIEDFITEDVGGFLSKIEDISGLGLLSIKPEMTINKLGYNILNITPAMEIAEDSNGNIVFDANISIDGIKIDASSIDINFVLPELISSEKLVALKVSLMNPVVNFSTGYALPLHVKIKLIKVGDTYKVEFPPTEMDKLARSLKESLHAFDFSFSDLKISEDVSLLIMGQTLTVNQEGIANTITERKEDLKKILVEQLSTLIQKDGVKAMLNLANGEIFPSKYWMNENSKSTLPFLIDIHEVKKYSSDIVQIAIDGDFCSRKNYVSKKEVCLEHKEIIPFKNMTTDKQLKKSLEINKSNLKANHFIASVSENYINKLLSGLIEDGLWDDTLAQIGIELGPRSAFVKFDKRGDSALAYIDVVYDVGRFKGVVLNRRRVRFPVILDLKLRIEYLEGEYEDSETGEITKGVFPQIIFKVQDVLLEDNILRHGVKKYDLISTIQKIRWGFRGITINAIRKELFDYDMELNQFFFSKWLGVDLPPLVLPQIENLKLEKMIFQNDGNGRGNFIYSGQEALVIERN